MSLREVELRKLQYVVTLARVRNFARAAEELHLTQSALTRSIQSIEKRFMIRLFDRDRSGVDLTPVGREFLKRAQSLLVEANDLARFADRSGRGEVGEVAFGLSTLPAKMFLTSLTVEFFSKRPQLSLSVAVRDPPDLLKLLAEESIEFFLAAEVPESPNAALDVTELAQFRSALAVRIGHPLLKKRKLAIEDISPFPVLVGIFEPGSHRESTETFARQGIIMHSNDYCSLMEITQQSDAIWFTSMPMSAFDFPKPGLACLPIKTAFDENPMTLKVARLARRSLSPAAEDVLAGLIARCAEMAAKNPSA